MHTYNVSLPDDNNVEHFLREKDVGLELSLVFRSGTKGGEMGEGGGSWSSGRSLR